MGVAQSCDRIDRAEPGSRIGNLSETAGDIHRPTGTTAYRAGASVGGRGEVLRPAFLDATELPDRNRDRPGDHEEPDDEESSEIVPGYFDFVEVGSGN